MLLSPVDHEKNKQIVRGTERKVVVRDKLVLDAQMQLRCEHRSLKEIYSGLNELMIGVGICAHYFRSVCDY